MRLFRRAAALLLLVSFAGLESAAASCHMAAAGVAQAADTNVPDAHAHHSGGAADARDPAPVDPTQPPSCELMVTCAAAAPAPAAEAVQSGPLASDASAGAPSDAYMAPSIDFEPPPPRSSPI